MNKKVLILTAHFGLGHLMATEGLKNALDEKGISYNVIDIVEDGGNLEKKTSKMYEKFMKSGRLILKLIYPNRFTSNILVRNVYRYIYKRKYYKKIDELHPDIIIADHHIATLIAVLYKKTNPDVMVYSVVTDYVVHPLWIWEDVERYFVGLEATRNQAISFGASEKRVFVTGIPLRKPFWTHSSKSVLRKKLSLPAEKFIVLVYAGSYDSTSITPVLEYLAIHKNAYPIVLTGKKKESYKKYSEEMKRLHLEGKVYPFIDFMSEVMASSDIFITKAGGLSIAEGMASGLAMIFLDSIPGQEEGNAFVIKNLGAGLPVRGTKEATVKLKELMGDARLLHEMQSNAERNARPNSSRDIIKMVMGG